MRASRPQKPIGGTVDRTIKRVLVANRGEIAVRIIRAAKDVGITSVAVYADSDSEGLFVQTRR
ncbi:hypothetical protein JCM18916A_00870 [Cutibacterium acnes subsp. acnes]